MRPARTIRWITAGLLASALLVAPAAAQKVLRYAFPIAETGFDPAQLSDLYSITLVDHIFDPPIIYDYLARPVQLRPNTTDGMPEISADGKTITVKIRPGIYFADDPLFQGKKRELTAEDYVYSLKRHFDPLIGIFVVHIVDAVHGGDVGGRQPVHDLVEAVDDIVEIEVVALDRFECRCDLLS